jgi:hypothetical protein
MADAMTINPDDNPEIEDTDDDDPNDPAHRDYDLSTSAPYEYDSWEDNKPWYLQRWLLLVVAIVIVFSLVLPYLLRF